MTLTELIEGFGPRDESVWDALWQDQPIGRVALAIAPSEERIDESKRICASLCLDEPKVKPARWTEEWRQLLIDQIAVVHAQMQLPGDLCPALYVPGSVHGQSQGICDVFGARVEAHPDGLFYVHPLPPDPKWVNKLVPGRLEESIFWGAVEWIRWARATTGRLLGFRIPVMTGPLDTTNYILGTTTLMDWICSEPAALHDLLDRVTGVIIDMILAMKTAAGGMLYPETFFCMRGGFSLCSECRSLVSKEHYEEFEAPYLRRIGEALGEYGIHSCGSWERTVESSISDPNLRAMHGQVRENNLELLCELSGGRITFAIGPSENLSELYTWSNRMDFYRHVLETVPSTQPVEMMVREVDLPHFERIQGEIRQ